MNFETRPRSQPESTSQSPIFQATTPSESSSDSLIDYMPQTILTKKEKKKQAKEKKKQDKEKARIEKEKKIKEEREKHDQLIKDMKESKKSKKEKVVKPKTSKPSQTLPPSQPKTGMDTLFQTLTQKSEDTALEESVPFVPFTGKTKTQEEGMSKLRIIPNVADINTDSSAFTAFTSTQSKEQEKPKTKSKDLLICEQCGSILSSDYTFCNKCGNKL